jgi:hypothetical protein
MEYRNRYRTDRKMDGKTEEKERWKQTKVTLNSLSPFSKGHKNRQ